jgi:hypothetical protein
MVDKRFIEETDVLSDLDQRPNLLELTPAEFESLIHNLFTKMGLDTKQTWPSRDGGWTAWRTTHVRSLAERSYFRRSAIGTPWTYLRCATCSA